MSREIKDFLNPLLGFAFGLLLGSWFPGMETAALFVVGSIFIVYAYHS